MSETVRIERMSYGSAGIGHLDNGKTVFVEGAIPGDTVKLEIINEKPRFAIARALDVVSPSSNRIDTKSTGPIPGAPWAHIAYETQLEFKRTNLVDALRRVGHLDAERAENLVGACLPSKHEWGYRNKIELATCTNESSRFTLGMYEQGSDKVIPITEAPLANRDIQKAPKALTGALRYLQGSNDLGIFRVGVRNSIRTGSTEISLWTEPSPFPRKAVARTLQDALNVTSIVRVMAEPGKARKVKKVEALFGDGFWKEKMKDVSFAVSAPSFFQVNTEQAEKLVNTVMNALNTESGMYIDDLYCGVGTFAIPLAKSGADVVAIESAGSSVRDLRRNAKFNGAELEIIGDDVARVLPDLGCFDAIVVDPPRAGLEKKVVSQIASAKPTVLAYVSCDPQTFARDTLRLEEMGLKLKSATPVDLFPQTYHCETVGIFSPA